MSVEHRCLLSVELVSQVEPGTAFGRWYRPGVFPLAREIDAAALYREVLWGRPWGAVGKLRGPLGGLLCVCVSVCM